MTLFLSRLRNQKNFDSTKENLKICDLIFHTREDFFIALEIKGAFDSDITRNFQPLSLSGEGNEKTVAYRQTDTHSNDPSGGEKKKNDFPLILKGIKSHLSFCLDSKPFMVGGDGRKCVSACMYVRITRAKRCHEDGECHEGGR
jgi:hypothetical protein